MNIAFLAEPRTWAPLQNLLRWLVPAVVPLATTPPARGAAAVADLRPACQRRATRVTAQPPAHSVQRRPLRVVRVMESGQSAAQVGRMVISGRMADVCAELDRLAACEATAR
jgi:hypothetical protein